jgi:hypothetical protein
MLHGDCPKGKKGALSDDRGRKGSARSASSCMAPVRAYILNRMVQYTRAHLDIEDASEDELTCDDCGAVLEMEDDGDDDEEEIA